MKKASVCCLLISFLLLAHQAVFALAKEFERNGEVYMLLNHVPGYDYAIWRMYVPSTQEQLSYPKMTNIVAHQVNPSKYDADMLDFSVDINRNIFTIASPKYIDESPDKIYRQVIRSHKTRRPNDKALKPAEDQYSTTQLKTVFADNFGVYVDNNSADYGCHSYIHHDQRYTAARGKTNNTTIYRSVADGENGATRYAKASYGDYYSNGVWTGFKCKVPDSWIGYVLGHQGELNWCANPDYMTAWHPVFSKKALALMVYADLEYGLIPNGSWFTSWRCRGWDPSSGCWCGGSNSYKTTIGHYYYQVFRDVVKNEKKYYDLVKWAPSNLSKAEYTSGSPQRCTTVQKMTFTRSTLAGCIDGCGGADGNESIGAKEFEVYVAFQPYNGTSQVYTYTKQVKEGNKTVSVPGTISKTGGRSYTTVGANNADVKWIGVSSKSGSSDYLYLLGQTQIEKWVKDLDGSLSGTKIEAARVSNQWNEKGGVLFAFDGASGHNYIIKMDFNGTSPEKMRIIQVKELLKQIKAKAGSKIDDIAADGFGNLYISMTYPSTDPKTSPATLGYNFNDATSYSYTEGESNCNVVFKYEIKYSKSVFKLNSEGGDLKKIGGDAELGKRTWTNQVDMTKAKFDIFKSKVSSKLPWSGMNTLVNSCKSAGPWGYTDAGGTSTNIPATALSKLSVINVPTPPSVYSLGNQKKSYLDIIGGYHGEIPPLPDTDRNITNQHESRSNSLALNTNQLYYYMVENYPIPGNPQNPNVEISDITPRGPDYDSDGQPGGFVSTIKDGAKVGETVKYYWQLWAIQDYNKKPYVDSNGNPIANKMGKSNTYYTTLYAPLPGKYILTCSAKCSWYDYDQVNFTSGNYETHKDFMARAKEGSGLYTKWALASGKGTFNESTGLWSPSVKNAKTHSEGLAAAIRSLYSDYTPGNGDPAKEDIVSRLTNQILNDAISANGISGNFESGLEDPNNYIAFEKIIVTGKGIEVPPDPSVDVVLLQRHCVENKATNWQPAEVAANQAQPLNPTAGYHGIDTAAESYWRIAVSSQTLFLLSDAENALYKTGNAEKDKKIYNYVASKVKDTIGDKVDIKFRKNGSDVRWSRGSQPDIVVDFEYTGTDANGNLKPKHYKLGDNKMIYGSNQFIYFKIPANVLPPTDPYVGKVSISMSRMLEYDGYIYDKNGNSIMSDPIHLPKKFEIRGEANLMVVDNQPPKFKFSKTSPKQLFGETGELLTNAGNGNSTASVTFALFDNNQMETVSTKRVISKHAHWNAKNITDNKNILNSTNPADNMKPVFNPNNRKVDVSFSIPQLKESGGKIAKDTSTGKATEEITKYLISYSSSVANNTNNPISVRGGKGELELVDSVQELYGSLFKMDMRIDKLNNGTGPLRMPYHYANNSSGYQPIKFEISACDSSGNVCATQSLNLIIDIKDTIAPFPYGEVTEFKHDSSNTIRFPRFTASSNSYNENGNEKSLSADAWINTFVNMAKYSRSPKTQNNIEISVPEANYGTGKVGSFGSDFNSYTSNQFGYVDMYLLPHYKLTEITSFSNTNNGTLKWDIDPYKKTKTEWGNLPPANIVVEENVETMIRAGGIDNSGYTSTSMTYKYVDLEGNKQSKTINSAAGKNKYDGTPNVAQRVVFRQSKDVNFPYLAPITITVTDNARGWDTYQFNGGSDWVCGTPKVSSVGKSEKHSRTLKTCIPIYGVSLDTRVLEKHIKPIE